MRGFIGGDGHIYGENENNLPGGAWRPQVTTVPCTDKSSGLDKDKTIGALADAVTPVPDAGPQVWSPN